MKEYINNLIIYFIIMSIFFSMRKDKSSFFKLYSWISCTFNDAFNLFLNYSFLRKE